MTPDLINGLFETIGGLLLFLHSRRVIKDKEVKGVSVPPMLFFLGWGAWNLFYYPHLGQWFSFLGGCVILAGNLLWVALVVHYKGWVGKLRCRLGLHRKDTTYFGSRCFGYLDWRLTRRCLRCGDEYVCPN